MNRIVETIAFLRMASAQMQNLSERAPEIERELQHMASQLQAEADELEKEKTE
jgi:hypothetical protein